MRSHPWKQNSIPRVPSYPMPFRNWLCCEVTSDYLVILPSHAVDSTTDASSVLPTPEIAIERVAQRVLEGGHSIPKDVIRRRYQAGIDNLFNIYLPIVDSWMIAENYQMPRVLIADGGLDSEPNIYNQALYLKIQRYVRN